MATPEGLEPPTSWFEAKRSIQLSYGAAANQGNSEDEEIQMAFDRPLISFGSMVSGIKSAELKLARAAKHLRAIKRCIDHLTLY